jgi:hypothetical protein
MRKKLQDVVAKAWSQSQQVTLAVNRDNLRNNDYKKKKPGLESDQPLRRVSNEVLSRNLSTLLARAIELDHILRKIRRNEEQSSHTR